MGFGLDCGEGIAVVGCKLNYYDDYSDQGMHIINLVGTIIVDNYKLQ